MCIGSICPIQRHRERQFARVNFYGVTGNAAHHVREREYHRPNTIEGRDSGAQSIDESHPGAGHNCASCRHREQRFHSMGAVIIQAEGE